MSPPGYQVPVLKASLCGNERQERSDRKKAGRKGCGKKSAATSASRNLEGKFINTLSRAKLNNFSSVQNVKGIRPVLALFKKKITASNSGGKNWPREEKTIK